ncbi:MAG: lysophospholipid acyltransferase family protein [Gemmataceae bacterium]
MPFDSPLGRIIYPAMAVGSMLTLSAGFRFRVFGREHLLPHGPCLIVSNHQCYLDPWFAALAVSPRKLTHLARSTLFHRPRVGQTLRFLGGVPIDRGFGRDGLKTVVTELQHGAIIIVFAEGERTHTGALQPLKPGLSLVLSQFAVPVIPMRIVGAFDVWPRQRKSPRFGPRVTVHFGPIIPSSHWSSTPRETWLPRIAQALADLPDGHQPLPQPPRDVGHPRVVR